jgi:hypothetical protein
MKTVQSLLLIVAVALLCLVGKHAETSAGLTVLFWGMLVSLPCYTPRQVGKCHKFEKNHN